MMDHIDSKSHPGVASAAVSRGDILLTGIAGLVAGAMSMAAGEYVSVSSQSDTEHADLAREKRELADNPVFEREELAQIYVARGVEAGLAREVVCFIALRSDIYWSLVPTLVGTFLR
jgi:VIT1/CCC1 family predicted Fe2+/Mn2+ transporter